MPTHKRKVTHSPKFRPSRRPRFRWGYLLLPVILLVGYWYYLVYYFGSGPLSFLTETPLIAVMVEEVAKGVIKTQTPGQYTSNTGAKITDTKTQTTIKITNTNVDKTAAGKDKQEQNLDAAVEKAITAVTNGSVPAGQTAELIVKDDGKNSPSSVTAVVKTQADAATTTQKNKDECLSRQAKGDPVDWSEGGGCYNITQKATLVNSKVYTGASCPGASSGIGGGQWAQTGEGIRDASGKMTEGRYCVQCGGARTDNKAGDGVWGNIKEQCGAGAATNYVTRPDEWLLDENDPNRKMGACWKNGTWYADAAGIVGDDRCLDGEWMQISNKEYEKAMKKRCNDAKLSYNASGFCQEEDFGTANAKTEAEKAAEAKRKAEEAKKAAEAAALKELDRKQFANASACNTAIKTITTRKCLQVQGSALYMAVDNNFQGAISYNSGANAGKPTSLTTVPAQKSFPTQTACEAGIDKDVLHCDPAAGGVFLQVPGSNRTIDLTYRFGSTPVQPASASKNAGKQCDSSLGGSIPSCSELCDKNSEGNFSSKPANGMVVCADPPATKIIEKEQVVPRDLSQFKKIGTKCDSTLGGEVPSCSEVCDRNTEGRFSSKPSNGSVVCDAPPLEKIQAQPPQETAPVITEPIEYANVGTKCDSTLGGEVPSCSEVCDKNSSGNFSSKPSNGSVVCDVPPVAKVTNNKILGTITAGGACVNGGNDACKSSDCRNITNPSTGKKGWYCMATEGNSLVNKIKGQWFGGLIGVDESGKKPNGAWCQGHNDVCKSNYCSDNSGYFFVDTCEDNPFSDIVPTTSSQSPLNLTSDPNAVTTPAVATADVTQTGGSGIKVGGSSSVFPDIEQQIVEAYAAIRKTISQVVNKPKESNSPPPGLTDFERPVKCQLVNGTYDCDGKRMYDAYQWYKNQPNQWYNQDGDFTTDEFLAMIIVAETGGDSKLAKPITEAVINSLWGDLPNESQHDPYCTAANKNACPLNYAAQYSQSAVMREQALYDSNFNPSKDTQKGLLQELANYDEFVKAGHSIESIANQIANARPHEIGLEDPVHYGSAAKWAQAAISNDNTLYGTTQECGIYASGTGGIVATLGQANAWTGERCLSKNK